MLKLLPHTSELKGLTADGRLLFITRCVRLFGYGLVSVILVLYLAQIGLPDPKIGLLLTLTLLGDTAISLWITTSADRVGRKRMLIAGAVLLVLAGVAFTLTRNYWLLLLAATVGVISLSGNEVGPFLSIEQASLAVVDPDERSAASGITGVARTAGAALSPSLAGLFLAVPALIGVPFLLSGGLKLIYDVLLYRSFKSLKPVDEHVAEQPVATRKA